MSLDNKVMWDDTSINVSKEVALVWSIANKLRGPYKPDKYKDVIIPMTIIRRFECALEDTKAKVLEVVEKIPNAPAKKLCQTSGYDFYNTSRYTLKELLNDSDNIADNFISYLNGFSSNVQDIINSLEFAKEIEKMDKNNRLLGVVKAFSELDLNPKTVDNIKMGYIFEDIIRRFSENAEAGDHYTPREVIRLLVNILMAEGCDDLYEENKVATVLDMACGTGGMLSTANDYIKRLNGSARVELFGQEINPESYAICLADMLIKGQKADHIVLKDTMIKDAFEGQDMRFVIANPPFGQAWGGKDAGEGVEKAVNDEAKKGFEGRFGAGTPGTGDMQLLFFQHALNKLDDNCGRAAIICNGSPLFSGGTTSGESQIRKWMIDEDYIEAIIGLPTDLFYNTNIGIYCFIFSKNKEEKRKNKIQLINATSEKFWTPLRKSLGKKRKEISKDQIRLITELYADFEENEYSKIFNKDEFKYKEYAVYQPMQRDYAITTERIDAMINDNVLSALYDQDKVDEYMLMDPIPAKEKKKLDEYISNKPIYDAIIEKLRANVSDTVYMSETEFLPVIKKVLEGVEKKHLDKVIDALSIMNKQAEIHKDKKGNIIYDTSRTKDTEIVKFTDNVDDYMEKEVVPHVPDAAWFFEEKLDAKKPVIKTGAEFPFTRYFYEYLAPEAVEDLEKEFMDIEKALNSKISALFEEV
jgi:type I restriction enzyme M protein